METTGSGGAFILGSFDIFDHGDEIRQFFDRAFDIVTLGLQQIDAIAALFDSYAPLDIAAVVQIIKIDHLTDFGQAETDALGPQYPGQAGTVSFRINARKAHSFRRDQALVFIKTQCINNSLGGTVS